MKYQLLLICALWVPFVRAERVVAESAPMSASVDLSGSPQTDIEPGETLSGCAWNNTDGWTCGGDPAGEMVSVRILPIHPLSGLAVGEAETLANGVGEGVTIATDLPLGYYRVELIRGGEVLESHRVNCAGALPGSATMVAAADTRILGVRAIESSAAELGDFACNNTADWVRGGDPAAAWPEVRIYEMEVNGQADEPTAWTELRRIEAGVSSCAAAEDTIQWACSLPSYFRADLIVGGAVASSAYFDFTRCTDPGMPRQIATLDLANFDFTVIRTGDGDRVEAALVDDEGNALRQNAGEGGDFTLEILSEPRRGENLRLRITGDGDWYGTVVVERCVTEIVFESPGLVAGVDAREPVDGVWVLGDRTNLLALAWASDAEWRRGGGEAAAVLSATPVMPVAVGGQVVWLTAGEGETLVSETGEGTYAWTPSSDYYRLTLAQDGEVSEQAIVDLAAVRELGTLVVENGDWPQIGKPLRVIATAADGETAVTLAANWTRKSPDRSVVEPLAAGAEEYAPTAADVEKWLALEVLAADGTVEYSREFWCSKLPVVYVTTDDGAMPTANKEDHSGRVRVQGNARWQADKYLYDGVLEKIHVRGNSTKDYPKKPYKLKLDKKADLLGMGKNKHWVLLANWQDPGLMRNKTAYDLSAELGLTAMASEWVDVIFNGEFVGNYQLCEQIRIDKERINIHNWEDTAEETAGTIAKQAVPEKGAERDALEDALIDSMTANLSWLTTGTHTLDGKTYVLSDYGIEVSEFDLSGGYVYELDAYDDELSEFRVTSEKIQNTLIKVNSPETLYSNPALMKEQQAFWTEFFDAVQSENGYANGKSWTEMADVRAMAAYWLTQVLVANPDLPHSRYAYRDQGGKLVFGPAWDYDQAYGGWAQQWKLYGDASGITSATEGFAYVGWLNGYTTTAYLSPNDNFYPLWVDDPYFCLVLYELWQAKRVYLKELVADGGTLDQNYDYLLESALANDALWPVQSAGTAYDRFDGELGSARRMKSCLKAQIEWIDTQMTSLGTLVASLRSAASDHPYTDAQATYGMSFARGTERRSSTEQVTPDLLVPDDEDLAGQVTVGDGAAVSVEIYVNGIAICTNQIAGGTVAYAVPSAALTADGKRNLVALIARNSSGAVCGTTYALVTAVASSKLPEYLTPDLIEIADNEAEPTGNPIVRVRLPGGQVLTEGRDYRVSYENKSATEVKVVVTGLGNEGGAGLVDGQINFVGETEVIYESGLRVPAVAISRRVAMADTRKVAVRKLLKSRELLPFAWNNALSWPCGGEGEAKVTVTLQPMTGVDPADPAGWTATGAAQTVVDAAGEGAKRPRGLQTMLYKATLGDGEAIEETAYFDLTEMVPLKATMLIIK